MRKAAQVAALRAAAGVGAPRLGDFGEVGTTFKLLQDVLRLLLGLDQDVARADLLGRFELGLVLVVVGLDLLVAHLDLLAERVDDRLDGVGVAD